MRRGKLPNLETLKGPRYDLVTSMFMDPRGALAAGGDIPLSVQCTLYQVDPGQCTEDCGQYFHPQWT